MCWVTLIDGTTVVIQQVVERGYGASAVKTEAIAGHNNQQVSAGLDNAGPMGQGGKWVGQVFEAVAGYQKVIVCVFNYCQRSGLRELGKGATVDIYHPNRLHLECSLSKISAPSNGTGVCRFRSDFGWRSSVGRAADL